MAASETIELTEGHTKSIVLRWEVEPVKRRAISAVSFVTGSPVIDTVSAHDIPDGWRCWVEGSGIKGLDVLDTAKIDKSEYHPATVLSTTSINLNDVSVSKLKAWVSGGFVCYNTPATLTGHAQRIRLRDRKGGNLLVCTSPGTTGTTKPTGPGTDGTVTWAKGSPSLVEKVWVAGMAASLGDVCDVSVIASSDVADAPLNLITITPNLTTFTILLTFSAACSVALAGKTAYGDIEDVSPDATPVITQLASLLVKVGKGMNIDQTVINWILTIAGGLIGAVLKTIWESVKELQSADAMLVRKVGEIEVLVAGKYVLREELERTITALFTKLDKIETKIDQKADK